jgi:hypothetical protein
MAKSSSMEVLDEETLASILRTAGSISVTSPALDPTLPSPPMTLTSRTLRSAEGAVVEALSQGLRSRQR